MDIPFLINEKLKDEDKILILSKDSTENPIVFTLISDISMEGKYKNVALVCRKDFLTVLDFETKEETEPLYFSDVKEFFNKRMYTNSLLRAKLKNGTTRDILRFSFSVVRLGDAAVNFCNSVINGEDFEETKDIFKESFEKCLAFCPKCGRMLSNYGAQCLYCAHDNHKLSKFIKYIKPRFLQLGFTIFLSVLTTAMSLITPILTKELVDDIVPNKKVKLLIYIAVAMFVIQVVQHLLGLLRSIILRNVSCKTLADIRNDVYQKALHLPMRFYDKTSTGAVINRINSDTANLNGFMLRVSQEVVVQLFTMIGIIVVMIVMNWKLTLVSLCPIPIIAIGSRIFRLKIRPFYRSLWLKNAAVSSLLTDNLPGIRVIKSFASEDNATEQFAEKVEQWRETDYKAGKITNIYSSVVGALVSMGSILIWLIGGKSVIVGGESSLTIGLLVSFISYASMFYNPVNFFANFADAVQNAKNSAERLLDILDAELEHDMGKGNCDADMGGRIEFKNVTFSFDRSKKVLDNINLTIEPGDIIGIVGATGSGKSTLINLLLRYYDNYDGTILIDGKDIRDIDLKYYRSSIGYVQQEPQLFFDTIYNNISYGDGSFTPEEVINAADIANAHEFILRQPNGYDSVIGERGVGLSGGERQRVSIARAVLRNPKMLVFDEATASVDSETEHYIQEAIENLISGRTTIMIAHRLSTLSKANKIVVVDKGKIVEYGTPTELMEKKGKYFQLVEIQSLSDKLAEERRAHDFKEEHGRHGNREEHRPNDFRPEGGRPHV